MSIMSQVLEQFFVYYVLISKAFCSDIPINFYYRYLNIRSCLHVVLFVKYTWEHHLKFAMKELKKEAEKRRRVYHL